LACLTNRIFKENFSNSLVSYPSLLDKFIWASLVFDSHYRFSFFTVFVILDTLMASPSSIFDSSYVGRNLLGREITPIGEVSSSERTELLFGEGEPTEEVSSPSLIETASFPPLAIALATAPTVTTIKPRKKKETVPLQYLQMF